MSISITDPRLLETQQAFDSVASLYDGPLGNNALIQHFRARLWCAVEAELPQGGRLLDLGCGTGIDALHFAMRGYEVVATDWSSAMVARARARVLEAGLAGRVQVQALGIQELDCWPPERFDAIYSDLGPLNCVLDLRAVAHSCAALLGPRGKLVVSVMGRDCPWEFWYYVARADWARARLRHAPHSVPVNLNRQTVWTRYYTPREFYSAFADEFVLLDYQALGLFMPPPYLIRLVERWRPLFTPLRWLDEHLTRLPRLRDAGDHFLMVLVKREDSTR